MAWSKGFFRIWLLLTVLWMGLVVALSGKDDFKGLWQPHSSISVEYVGNIKDVLDSAHSSEILRRKIRDGVSKGAAQLQRTDPVEAKKQMEGADQTADELLKVLADENTRRSDQLYRASTMLVAPPSVLLILGLAIAWVASGFRKQPKQPAPGAT